MKKLQLLTWVALSMMIFFTACNEIDPVDTILENETKEMEDLEISTTFDFNTTNEIVISIKAIDNNGQALAMVPVEIIKGQYNEQDGSIENEQVIFKSFTDFNGIVEGRISIPTAINSLFIGTDYVGLPNRLRMDVGSGYISQIIGGSRGPANKSTEEVMGSMQVNYITLGTWNSQGVPNYLLVPGDNIDSDLLIDINASLPEGIALPVSHPMYFGDDLQFGIPLQDTADVWVTFVHEGAGWKNTLGFFTYDASNPPARISDITNETIIFPNVSFSGSGGGLFSGDKVHLGTFDPGTVIQWFLVPGGWNSNSATIGSGYYSQNHYSISDLNAEIDALKQHSVLLYDEVREIFILGFEDINRELPNCDQDFNDAIFYATVNPITAVATGDHAEIDTPDDTDNDGVSDNFDEYPNDPDRAYNNYFPSENEFGTLAFEDLWPETGDYDFNDVVIDYQYKVVSNASNELVEMESKYVLQATGATYHNSFGIELPIVPAQITGVSGGDYSDGYISLNPNGTEANQSKAVIIAFEDAFDVLNYAGGGIGINTEPGAAYVTPDTLTQTISFNTGLVLSDIGTAPFNPFIIPEQDRTREVHLIDMAPTDLVDITLFGTNADASNPGTENYYKTASGLPWAIHLPESFEYPKEKEAINQAYLKFNTWAESAGLLFPDWYTNESGYRNSNLIY